MKVKIDWRKGWGNDPRVMIALDDAKSWPTHDEAVWEKRNGVHVAFQNPLVAYFYTNGEPTHGFNGRQFRGTFVDGTPFDYKGAWSSRAGWVNKEFPASLIVDVVLNDHISTALSADALIHWWKCNETDWGLCWITKRSGEKVLSPTLNGALKNAPRSTDIVEHLVK